MDKSMYSLMLMDSVINEIDKLAYAQNTNRSNLINQILADYVSIQTPEMRVKEIFDLMTVQVEALTDFKMAALPSDFMFTVKSPLQYKHRPTIKYSVELYRANSTLLGELRVVFRTQHYELLLRLSEFFNIFMALEKHYIKNPAIEYVIEEGRFRRTLLIPKTSDALTGEYLSTAIGDYIKMFDDLLKYYLYDNDVGINRIEQKYLEYINNGLIVI